MAKNEMKSGGGKENWAEKGSRWLRNFNLAVGAVALVGAGVVASPEISAGLIAYGAFNIAQAGFFEVTRRLARKNSSKKIGKTATANADSHWRPLPA